MVRGRVEVTTRLGPVILSTGAEGVNSTARFRLRPPARKVLATLPALAIDVAVEGRRFLHVLMGTGGWVHGLVWAGPLALERPKVATFLEGVHFQVVDIFGRFGHLRCRDRPQPPRIPSPKPSLYASTFMASFALRMVRTANPASAASRFSSF